MFELQEPNGRPFRQRDFSASLRHVPYSCNTLNPVGQGPCCFLPGLLGQIEQALTASDADHASVLAHLCAVASLMTQGVADGAWPNDRVLPAGCSTMTVVRSGVSKSLMTDLLVGPVRRAWDSRDVPSLDQSSDQAQESLQPGQVPKEGKGRSAPKLLIEDVSSTALIEHLVDWPVVGLFTDEAGMLAKLLREDASLMAKLSDGAPYSRSRGLSRVMSHGVV